MPPVMRKWKKRERAYLNAPRGKPFGDLASRGILPGLRSACVTTIHADAATAHGATAIVSAFALQKLR